LILQVRWDNSVLVQQLTFRGKSQHHAQPSLKRSALDPVLDSVLRTTPLSSHPLRRLDAQETQAGLHDGGGPGAEHETAGRYFSLSAQIRKERAQYYKELEAAQAGSLDATRWCV
jgi:metal-dependent amidase/aminoacylase/carboxypeptidase family protein